MGRSGTTIVLVGYIRSTLKKLVVSLEMAWEAMLGGGGVRQREDNP